MELADFKESGGQLDVFLHNAAISACGKGRQWKLALHLLGEMREAGLLPNVITYNAAISACEKLSLIHI